MRILTGGFSHESNSFNPIITGEEDFTVVRGSGACDAEVFAGYSSSGIAETLAGAGAEVVPTVLARAIPGGIVSGAFYAAIKEELLEAARGALKKGPIDGACLALHGSMKVEGNICAEGDLCTALRKILPGVPFTAALDMHATITPALLETVDGFAGYKTAPHTDCFETGVLAAKTLLASLSSGKKLYTASQSVPMMLAGEKSETSSEPMASLIGAARDLEKRGDVLAASLLLGFPWADSEHNAVTVLVTGFEENRNALKEAAGDLAETFWKKRGEFTFSAEQYDSRGAMEAAFDAVLERGERPVFVSDSGDNPTAGAAGDATELLETVLSMNLAELPTPLLYSGFYDAPAVSSCIEAGEGAECGITLGGNWDRVSGRKIPLRVRVEKIARSYGPCRADLVLLRHSNMLVSVTSRHIGFGDEGLLSALGVNPADYCLVLVKLGYLEPCFKKIAARAIMAASRGCSCEILETIPYRKVRRPIYPLDPGMDWRPAVQ
ncbi:MAG: M81 family metallopeptidase [Treponema sp.]|nr:M81 family metallopeptidase [Treponema sp.]